MKLNMGCGNNQIPDWVNVDKFQACNPDIVEDLEVFPWKFEDNSVSEILFNHSLEHMGATSEAFLNIMKELYRICKNGAVIQINVPHPRHDNFINDPTHVRIITPEVISLFSKKLNNDWIKAKAANSTLGIYLDVDFELTRAEFNLEPKYNKELQNGELTHKRLNELVRLGNNIISEIRLTVKVNKEDTNV